MGLCRKYARIASKGTILRREKKREKKKEIVTGQRNMQMERVWFRTARNSTNSSGCLGIYDHRLRSVPIINITVLRF